MSLCAQCFEGVKHEGTPTGTITTLAGISTYVATPPGAYAKDKVVLYLTDVFGLQLVNNRLLADSFAANGLRVVLPDLFDGEPIPEDALEPGNTFDRVAWRARHGPETARPRVDKAIAALRAEGVTRIGAVGFCYGGRLVFDLAFDHAVEVAVGTHPSGLDIADIDKYASEATAPLLLNTAEVDSAFPAEKQAHADAVLGGGKFKPGYERTYWEGCKHGFAVRGDLSDPKIKEGKEGSFKATVEWFGKHLNIKAVEPVNGTNRSTWRRYMWF
ncbi:alpha/beta-hydrolase [Dentipellis sp. KUC8613]|nr:alpha/beta-hydrolase [Dentipellis sp. KUC8613]